LVAIRFSSELSFSNCDKGTCIENRWSASYAGADAGMEVAPHPLGHGGRSAVALEAVEIEVEALGALSEVGIVDPAAVGIERVDHREEPALLAGGLGRRVQRRGARVLAGHREVTEGDPNRSRNQLRPGCGAVGATEVGVDDQPLPLAADVVVGADRRHRGAGQIARHAMSLHQLIPWMSKCRRVD
jgi:hypothetical protein